VSEHVDIRQVDIRQVDIHQDGVDDIVSAWQRERPDLDVTPLDVLSRVSRLARHLDIARRTAFAEHGLETGEFDVLAALRRSGPPYALSPGRLASDTLVSSGTMTNRLDQLEREGLITRDPDPVDGRSVRVHLTDLGRRCVDAALTDLLERERAILVGLDDGEQRMLANLLRAVVQPFDAPTSGKDVTSTPRQR
jgi:DNA-binding MarR family transcriptional regulator